MGDPKDPSILKLRAFRGVQPTDANGLAVFDTILPGRYEGRATHIHGECFEFVREVLSLTPVSHRLPRCQEGGQQHRHRRQGGAHWPALL